MKREDKMRFPGSFLPPISKPAEVVGQTPVLISELLSPALVAAKDLVDVEIAVLDVLKQLKDQSQMITFVSGPFALDDPSADPAQVLALSEYTRQIRNTLSNPVFSAADIFAPDLCAKLGQIDQTKLADFWQEILKSGYLAGIYFCPGRSDSIETVGQFTVQKEIAKEKNIPVVFL